MNRMTAADLTEARAWANACDHYPTKRGYLTLLDEIAQLHGEITRLKAELEESLTDHERTVESYDQLHDVADNLAAAIAPPEILGEHSNANDPWQNALDYAATLRRDQP